MRQTGAAFAPDAVPRSRSQAVAVLRRAVELDAEDAEVAAAGAVRLTANDLIRLDAVHRRS